MGNPATINVSNPNKALNPKRMNQFITMACLTFVVVGIWIRLFQITANTFFYYDEGMWLLQNQDFVRHIESSLSAGTASVTKLINTSFHLSLRTGKALWAFISQSRAFWVGADGYFFNRVVSAACGIVTIAVVFLFGRKIYQSNRVGLLAAAFLAVLPSHVYYSRLALQEGLSALLFLLGVYFYLSSRRIAVRTFVASVCFAAVFFANYRMIIIPFFVGFIELYFSLIERRWPDIRKYVYHVLLFLALVFGIGALDGGANTFVTFGWMFHQAHLAKGTFEAFNLLSYPYYVVRLEGPLFGLFLLGNVYLIYKREWRRLFAFVFVVLFMFVFSFTQEKGTRYLTSALPFMALAVGILIDSILQHCKRAGTWVAVIGVGLMSLVLQTYASVSIAKFENSYQAAIEDIRMKDPTAKFVSTQAMVQRMFVDDIKDVMEFKYGLRYLLFMYQQGYRYLVIDPQAYVSFTEDGYRFSGRLKGYMHLINEKIEPIRTYEHFGPDVLRRFVLEHNENLRRSIIFMDESQQKQYGMLKVYNLQQCIAVLQRGLQLHQQRQN